MNLGQQLKAHIERYCGTPAAVTAEDSLGIRAAIFTDVPDRGLVTTLTIGVGKRELDQRSGNSIRHELMTTVHERHAQQEWDEILFSAAKILFSRNFSFMLGEVIGPAGPLFPEAPWCHATALLCSLPLFFDADFAEPEFDHTHFIFIELIPITTPEAEWIKVYGWSAFFDKISSGEVDVLDLARPPVAPVAYSE